MKKKDDKTTQGENGMVSCDVVRIQADHTIEKMSDQVICEEAITIMVDKVGSFTLMATPTDLEALAVGFVFSEGMIDDIDDVVTLSQQDHLPHVVGIQVQDPTRISQQRNMIVASACGMCGVRNIKKLFSEMPAVEQSLKVSIPQVHTIINKLQSLQGLFQQTGGSHAAGIFTAAQEIIAFAEDLGRHNALDKAMGRCLMERKSLKGCGVALSGRVSLEMVTKAARAGIELIAAVSAASSMAIKAADTWQITLCGFVRPQRLNVYTHPQRILQLDSNDD